MNSIFNIKASIATLILGMAMLSNTPVKADTNQTSIQPQPAPVTNLTTLIDYTNNPPVPNPNWISVADRNGKSDCLQNLDTQKVLCRNIRSNRPIAEKQT